uniref:Ig-like domain-containing protein n=1 Tax=Chrysemys picta bellii TaxID=8478 RepID=A0A8C3P8D2_CHRPI
TLFTCLMTLKGPSQAASGREFLKPTIWVSPSRVVALGGSVTIRCAGRCPGMEFFLHKAGDPNPQVWTVPDGTVAEFPIPSVGREDGGSYTCDYRSIADQSRSSHPSDPVEIIVGLGEPSYPKPNISLLSPSGGVSLGGSVAVQCRAQCQGVRFVLNKEGRHFQPVDSNGFEVVFPISNVSREHGGSYSCSYHSRSEPFGVSYPSDPVELVVRGEGPGSASPFPAPPPARSSRGLGANGTLRARLFLYKGGIKIWELDRGMLWILGSSGRSSQQSLGSRRGSSGWVFSQGPRLWDRAARTGRSDCAGVCLTPCLLLTAETYYPKPSISLRPSGGVALGGAVTIRCRGWYQNVRFLLYKDGNPNAVQYAEPAGDLAEFPISNVSRRDAGSYSCYYHHKWYPFIWSYPSDPVELVVAGEGPGSVSPIPAPHPAGPSGQRHVQGRKQAQAPRISGPPQLPPRTLPPTCTLTAQNLIHTPPESPTRTPDLPPAPCLLTAPSRTSLPLLRPPGPLTLLSTACRGGGAGGGAPDCRCERPAGDLRMRGGREGGRECSQLQGRGGGVSPAVGAPCKWHHPAGCPVSRARSAWGGESRHLQIPPGRYF